VALVGALAVQANASPLSASVFLSGSNYIQSGTVTNNSDGGLNIIQVIYSLGTAADGIATWENYSETPAGYVKSGGLADGVHYQTISWSGLNIAPGATFNFGGLDIDFIQTMSPLVVLSSPLGGPSTLAHAYFSVVFSGGGTSSASLVQQEWGLDQNLTLGGQQPVPDPGSTLLLLGMGLVGLRAWRKRQ
jgi:hypothetical protein